MELKKITLPDKRTNKPNNMILHREVHYDDDEQE